MTAPAPPAAPPLDYRGDPDARPGDVLGALVDVLLDIAEREAGDDDAAEGPADD